MKRLRAKKPHPQDEAACDTYAAEMQLAENDRERWNCPGDLPLSAEAEVRDEARYAADVMGLPEPFGCCPFREMLRPTRFQHEVQSACAAMGETFSPAAWQAITGRYPTARDVEAYLLVRRAQGDVQRSDDEIRKAKQAKE